MKLKYGFVEVGDDGDTPWKKSIPIGFDQAQALIDGKAVIVNKEKLRTIVQHLEPSPINSEKRWAAEALRRMIDG